jgi:hypothetical protein
MNRMASAERTGMKVTTVRFGTDLWRLLEAEASYAGMSVSQYIREAALARAAAAAAARGHGPFELFSGALREVMRDEPDPATRAEAERVLAGLARLAASGAVSEATALRAQAEQAQVKHKKVHQTSESMVGRRTA